MSDAATPATPATARPDTSATRASCGRIVHVFSKDWEGPRPAMVLSASNPAGNEPNVVRVNVLVDTKDDMALPTVSLRLYDPMTDEQRAAVGADGSGWAEWMPYQKGQATKTDELTPKVEALATSVAALEQTVQALTTPAEDSPSGIESGPQTKVEERISHIEAFLRNSTSFETRPN